MSVMLSFRDDLRNGEGLWDSLDKYGLTLKEAFESMEKPYKPRPRGAKFKNIKSRYIYRNGLNYLLQKTIDGVSYNFGTYTSIEDAERVRDYYEEYGWNHESLDSVCDMLGIERSRKKR